MRERLSEGTIYFSSQTNPKIITKRGTFFSVQIIPDKARMERKNCLVFFLFGRYNLTIRDLHFSVWTISFQNLRQAGTEQVMSFCQPLASTFSLWSVHTRQPRDKTGLTFRMTSIREEMSFFSLAELN